MMRPMTTIGCSLAMAFGAAGFLGCEEQGLDQGTYGTETEIDEGLDTRPPAVDGTGVGLDTEPMRGPAVGDSEQPMTAPDAGIEHRPGTPAPQDMQTEPRTPSLPAPQTDPGTGGM